MKKFKDLSKGEQIKAILYSKPNYLNGKYKSCHIFGLDNLREIKNNDIFFLETLEVRANSADKIIAEAEKQGKDTTDPKVLKELGKEINALGEPIHKSESIMTAVFVSLQLVMYYGIAISIWGLVFRKSFLVFGFYGVIVGLLISLLFVAPIIAFQRTKERIRDMSFSINAMWGILGIIVGIVGLVALIIRIIFF